jgi:plastocyanin
MMKKIVIVLLLCSAAFMLLAACGSSADGTSTSASPNEVHTVGTSFAQPSITIAKGSTLTLVDDDSMMHIITNGSWVNGVAKAAHESGAPLVSNLQLNGNSKQQIGPFTMAGTYHLYCTLHLGMNLTVIVQ